jgi:hypothetical protein
MVSPAVPFTFIVTQPTRFCPKSITCPPAGVLKMRTGLNVSCFFTGSFSVANNTSFE